MEDLKIRLVLEGAEQVQTGATKAGDALGKLGQAGQRAGQQAQLSGQQMAQVSAQLQDFFIQIQGGQAPITALLQQGSQLTTVFGSMGGALRAVGGFAATLINPFTVAAAAASTLGFAFLQGQQEAQAYGRALTLSGNAAGATVGQMQALALAQSQIVGTQGQAAEALAALAATGRVSAAGLSSAAEAATRLARVGVPLEETAKKFASLGKEPLKALLDLNDAENFLTSSVYKQIKALEDRGRKAEAAGIAQAEYARISVERAKELEGQLGTLETAWKNVGDVAKKAWGFMLNIGREDSAEIALTKVQDQIRAAEEKIARARSGELSRDRPFLDAGRVASAQERVLAGLKTEQESLQEVIRLAGKRATLDAERKLAVDGLRKADEDAAKAASAVNAEREREAAALERAVGLSGSYQKDLTQLQQLRQRGKLTEEQYVAAVEKVIQQQPMVREQLEALAAASKKAVDARNDQIKAEERRIEALSKGGEQTAAQVLKLLEEEAATSLAAVSNISLAEAIERVTIARLAEAEAKARAAGDYGAADALAIEISQREKLAGLIGRKEARDAAKRGAEDAAKEWKRTTDEIERSLTDALLRGFESGKGFARNLRDTLVNLFKTQVLRLEIQPIIRNLAGSIGSLLGLPGNALASIGGSAGGLGSAGNLASLLGFSGLGSAFSGGFGLTMSGAGGTGLALQGSGAMVGSGAYAQGFAQAAGALAPWALGAAAGIYGGRAISGGYAAGGGSGNTAVNIGTAAGAIFGGPIGAAIGGAIGGLVNRAFGRKAKEVGETGIEGTASMGGFAGQAYAEWLRKGGWFRSDKRGTDYSAVSAEQDTVLDQGITALYSATEQYAKVLGYPVDALKGYAASFKVALGKTDEENQAAIQAAFVKLGDDLASRYVTQLAPLQKAGESLSATLQRLSTLQVFSNSLGLLGGVFSRLATSSVSAREQLIDLAGGMDALSQQALGFAQNYYNRDEIAGLKARELQTAFSAAGIAADPGSREQFRALVEAQDPNTDAGRKQLAALLALQGSFATVADYLSETGQTLSQAAAQAPADALMSPLLSSVGQQLQLAQQSMEAQYETRDATLMVVQALGPGGSITAAVERLTNAVAGSRVGGYRQPEVVLAN
ncbi:phage tail length tape measure family protein [Paucibacter sp. O1-1]|nr:phage tail length tape measure family protein [Paucibacter sp. O1-1]MDA3826498.1 phage tail length tape measure family protein [Paucibacter sp. O1-1]